VITLGAATLAITIGAGYLLTEPGAAELQSIACSPALQQCQFKTAAGVASLELTPLPVRSSRPFQLNVSYPGDAPERIWFDLQGKKMYMGVNQVELEPHTQGWSAQANLGICTTGTMTWVLKLVVEQQDGQQVYQFEFDAS